VIPFLTRLRTRNADAAKLMRYFWDTIDACVPPESILAALRDVGFADAKRHIEVGVFSEYTAVK
jgi:demethylmenaquinone methyltransferase/2-methoxy-6-polyprenyl-1,4-benzoquinol methylase